MLVNALKQQSFTLRSSAIGNEVGGLNMFQRISGATGLSNYSGNNGALTLSAFYNGIEIICNDFAKLPKGVFQKTPDGKGREAIAHPVKYLIDKRPNQYMTSFQFDKLNLMYAILKGNGYAIKEYNDITGEITAMQIVDQDKTPVTVTKSNSKLFYKIAGKTYPSDDILHIPGFSFNGITGVGVITHAARSLGTSLAVDTFASDYYDGKGVGMGVLTTSKQMDPDAKTRYSSALSDMFARKSKWIVPVIDEASKFEHIKITPQEAQFIVSSEHGINEIARWLNINPQKLKHYKDINNSITESLERQHVNDSILPWAIKFQQEYDTKLFSPAEIAAGIYTKFNTNSLLSADMVQQADTWSKLIFAGVYTRNYVRSLLELNPLDGLDEPLTPVNTQIMEKIMLDIEKLEAEKPQS